MELEVDKLLPGLEARRGRLVAFLREMVECESPSDEASAVDAVVALVAARLEDVAKVKTVRNAGYGRQLICEFRLPGARPKKSAGEAGQILALGHLDTVWPVGTLRHMPWREAEGKLWGPGVFDMKAGVALFAQAMRALVALDRPVGRKVVLQLNSDEEIGSPASRPLTEQQARRSAAVLVLEPALGPEGKLKTSRKGVGDYTVRVAGRSAHAGLDFEKGASAIIELARQIERIAAFTDLKRGVTVNPGVIRGGTRGNVIAAQAEVEVDLRLPRGRDYAAVDRKFRALRAFDRRCVVTVEGGLNRPPFERGPGTVRLLKLAQKLGAELGLAVGEGAAGGGSDGNFTAGLGVATLDGLGAVGDGAHAVHEQVELAALVPRAALLARLVESI
jgi:glutamate carboxypeptidase